MKDALNDATSQKTPQDIRFTAKKNVVYVFARSWKDAVVKVQSLVTGKAIIKTVQLLGYKWKLDWSQDNDGLQITLPTEFKAEIPVYTFKVLLHS